MFELEEYAKKNNVPIMQPDGIKFLKNYIEKNNIKNILEIGSAIGYSAICMAKLNKEIKVVTIERDLERYNEAVKNIKKFALEDQITIINDDAFNVNLDSKFDLIFIDAAKSQSTKFFLKFQKNLNSKGTIITDNINFHGLTYAVEVKNRNTRQLVRKIREYVEFLKENKDFTTTIVDDGDGIAISVKNN